MPGGQWHRSAGAEDAAAGAAARSLTRRGAYSAGRPGMQVRGVFMDP